jgi:hypothetical protein
MAGDRAYVPDTATTPNLAPAPSLAVIPLLTTQDNLKVAPNQAVRAVIAPPARPIERAHGNGHCEYNDTGYPGDDWCPYGSNHVREKWKSED